MAEFRHAAKALKMIVDPRIFLFVERLGGTQEIFSRVGVHKAFGEISFADRKSTRLNSSHRT